MPASTAAAMSPRLRLHHLLSILSALPTCPLDHSIPTNPTSAAAATANHHVVTTLPGYDGGELPFRLETGYIAVDEEHGAELFYYFVESEADPRRDPLLLWLTGGARCSVLSGVFFEIGPVRLALEHYHPYDAGELPRLRYHPHGWTKAASVLFVDSPVGAGWSFSRHPDGYLVGDVSASLQLKRFLAKWISDHPDYLANPFYIGGDSYAGKIDIVPFLAQKISEDIEAGVRPIVDLKVYLVGNPVTGESIDFDSRVPYAHGVGIISDQLYETIMEHCQGEDYSNPKNAIFCQALDRFNELLGESSIGQILYNYCIYDNDIDGSTQEQPKIPPFPPRECIQQTYGNYLIYFWANNNITREALGIKMGSVDEWLRCHN